MALKIDWSVKTLWQEYVEVACFLLWAPDEVLFVVQLLSQVALTVYFVHLCRPFWMLMQEVISC